MRFIQPADLRRGVGFIGVITSDDDGGAKRFDADFERCIQSGGERRRQ